jgi:serine/threonine protein kinase
MEQLHDGDPRSIGPYRVIGRLGSGGMGRVYLCTSPGGRRLAVKVIRPDLADDAGFRARFRREVATARLVRSHVTAAVVDADTESPTPWLATLFLDGPTLSAVVDQSPLAEPELRRLAAALAEALQSIHAAGLVHRDLKPSNIILAPDGPRVIDFGIARAVDATALTATNLRIGSPEYMAPEQILADVEGPECDIFALGAVLAYAATGRSPFGGGPTDLVLYRVLHQEPDLDDVPPRLRWLVAACLAKDPRQRPTPDLILQESTGDPATLVLSHPASGEASLPDDGQGPTSPASTQVLATPPVEPTQRMDAAAPLPDDQGSERRWIPLVLVALLVVGVGGAYLVSQIRDQGSITKTFSCSAGGYIGYIYLANTSTPVVSYKIVIGNNSGGNSANVYVSDGGVAPSRTYQTAEGIQDGAYHAMQGPYSRVGGDFVFTFVFDKSHWMDPSCSGGGYLGAG